MYVAKTNLADSAEAASPDTTEKSVSAPVTAYRRSWIILAVAWAVYFIDLFMRYNIPTVMPLLRQEHGWNAATVGWIDSAFLIAYAVSQLPWGYISERWLGARWTVTLGTAMIALASIVFAFHEDSIALAITARAVIGIGAAAVWVPLNPVLARWFAPSLRGTQTGLLAMGGALGTGSGGAVMPFLLTGSTMAFGLTAMQTGFLYSAIPGLIMMLIVPFVIRNRPEAVGLKSLDRVVTAKGAKVEAHDEPKFGHIMRTSKYPYLLAVVYAGYQGCKYFVWTWFASYLVAEYGLKLSSAGLLWAFVAAFPAAICQPLSGLISDKVGRVRALSVSLLVTVALSGCFILFAMLGKAIVPVWAILVTAVVFSVFVNMWVLVWPFTTIMFPTSAGGPIGGFMNTFAALVGSLAPVVSGYFIDATHSYTSVFVAGACCAAIGWYASRSLKEHRVV
ncbi:MFS transporter [Pandoraea terrae]|uniref:MFS transporter n=2 Tax=Pandoraea terrae TaxID=1537710 RepID=A0A5E4RDY7_9BURK|nr:MFS transporter [Pandoraea terrae]